jgi:hypothetical protein
VQIGKGKIKFCLANSPNRLEEDAQESESWEKKGEKQQQHHHQQQQLQSDCQTQQLRVPRNTAQLHAQNFFLKIKKIIL